MSTSTVSVSYRKHTHSSSNFLKTNAKTNCKRYSLAITRANSDILPRKSSLIMTKQHQSLPANNTSISSSTNNSDLSTLNLDDSILNKSIDFRLDNSITKSIESLRTLTKRANSLHQDSASSFVNLKRNSLSLSNSNVNSVSASIQKKQSKSSIVSKNRKNSNVQISNDQVVNNRYAITASLSNDAQYAMFKAYEDLLYQELKSIYPDLDTLILTKKFNTTSNTVQVDDIDNNKNREEMRKLKISNHIQTGIKILDLVRKLNKENKNNNNNNNAIKNTTSSSNLTTTNNNSTSIVSFCLINNNTNSKRRSSVLLNKTQTKQLLTNVTNSTTITVIDEGDEIEKSANEFYNEKDPLGLYIKWLRLLKKDYFI
jgi:hypothetical protein